MISASYDELEEPRPIVIRIERSGCWTLSREDAEKLHWELHEAIAQCYAAKAPGAPQPG